MADAFGLSSFFRRLRPFWLPSSMGPFDEDRVLSDDRNFLPGNEDIRFPAEQPEKPPPSFDHQRLHFRLPRRAGRLAGRGQEQFVGVPQALSIGHREDFPSENIPAAQFHPLHPLGEDMRRGWGIMPKTFPPHLETLATGGWLWYNISITITWEILPWFWTKGRFRNAH